MEKKELDEIRKLMQTTSQAKKPVKDIKTSILQDMNEASESDCKKEFFKMLQKLSKLRARLSKEENLTEDDEGKTIVDHIDKLLKNPIKSPKPTLDGKEAKYRFADGSEADTQSYQVVMNMFIENSLINRINEMQIVYSEALAEIMQLENEKDLWYKNDGIEEIDYIGENDGK